jgi:hypothetical protein
VSTLTLARVAPSRAARRLVLAVVLAAGLLTASLGAGTEAARAHALCSVGGSHTDYHTLYFHWDAHNYYSRQYLGQTFGSDGVLYNRWTYWYRNWPHGQFYSKSCRWAA